MLDEEFRRHGGEARNQGEEVIDQVVAFITRPSVFSHSHHGLEDPSCHTAPALSQSLQ